MRRKGIATLKGKSIPSKADLIVKNAKTYFDPSAFVAKHFPTFESGDLRLEISCRGRSTMDAATLDWTLALTETNMRALYEASDWGWNQEEKRAELEHSDAMYLLATGNGVAQGFVHFRLDTDFGKPVVYCYEIQLEKAVQRKGLGQFFTRILLSLAFETKMTKVVLTVLKSNKGAVNFYRNKFNFKIDETSPSVATNEDVCYEILSKRATSFS